MHLLKSKYHHKDLMLSKTYCPYLLNYLCFLWTKTCKEYFLFDKIYDNNGPAAKAGIKSGDIIKSINGRISF